MQTLERQVERSDNALTSDHLATLPKLNKDHFLSSFTREQHHFLQLYLYEGQRVARSWDDSEPISPPKVNPPAFPKNGPHLGFGTPVLRARLDLSSTQKGYRNGSIKASRNRTASGQECSKENERPAVHGEKLPNTVEHNLKSKAEWQKKNVSKAEKKRAKELNLRSDSDNESVQRRADRRQRKKIKRDIMNSEVPGDSDNNDKPLATCKVSKQAKRQSRSRQEFALMHGFSSTNVGKNRLTLKPGLRDIGVFQKGKASEKTITKAGKHKRQESGLIFSEAAFLNKSRQNVSKIDLEKLAKISTPMEEDSSVASSVSASPTKARTVSDKVKVRRKFKVGKVSSKRNLASNTRPQNQDKPQTGYNPANSVVWDIEQEESLGSEVSSRGKQGTIVLKVDHLPKTSNEVLALDTNTTTLEAREEPSQQKSLSVTQSDALSNPSLGPSQSASQLCLRTVDVASPPTAPSKYFKPLPPRLAKSHLASCYSINQLNAKPSAVSELGELPTIEDSIPEIPEASSHFLHSSDPSARSYHDGQEGGAILMPPMQPSYDLEVSAYESYPDSEFWSPVNDPDDLGVEPLDVVDHVDMNFNGQNNSNIVIPADGEMWPSDYIADGELDEMDHTSFISLSERRSVELRSIPQSIWQSDVYSEVSEMSQGLVYQDSESKLLMTDVESEDQQMQLDDDFNFNTEHDSEHEEISPIELYPDVVHHFWQGPSLLYGSSTPGDSTSLHKLSNVEADVARQLQLDHWQPQKL